MGRSNITISPSSGIGLSFDTSMDSMSIFCFAISVRRELEKLSLVVLLSKYAFGISSLTT